METANGKHFKTTQYVRAAHGKAERNWPFITCSDSPFTEVCIGTYMLVSRILILYRLNGIDTRTHV
jgi:hypothetical protein